MVAAIVVLALPSVAAAQDGPDSVYYEEADPAALDDFRAPLAPHGTWVQDGRHGTVWVPDVVVVGKDFAPYRTAGRWAVTDEGDWVWMSDYDWGYIPFHYGRWVWIPARGWAWVPGRQYAPAWVVWRTGEPGYSYIGWAPMPPSYYWYDGVAVYHYGAVTYPWWFCPSAFFFSPLWAHHIVHHEHSHWVAGHTRIYGGHYGQGHYGQGHYGQQGHKKAEPYVQGNGGASAHKAADGGVPDGAKGRIGHPASPTFAEAQVPQGSVPKSFVRADQKALAVARAPKGYRTPAQPLHARPGRQVAPQRAADRGGYVSYDRARARGGNAALPNLRPRTAREVQPGRVPARDPRGYAPDGGRSYRGPGATPGRYAPPQRSSSPGTWSNPAPRTRDYAPPQRSIPQRSAPQRARPASRPSAPQAQPAPARRAKPSGGSSGGGSSGKSKSRSRGR